MSFEGTQLGQYRLLRLIGSGGMGEVYLAEDARINQQVAIKVSRTEGSSYPDASSVSESARLFQREARAIAQLDHPRILPLFGYGEEQVRGETLTYIVMPYRREGSLVTWLRQRNNATFLNPQDIAAIVTQAADALQYSHDHNVIHQDVKPANFLVRNPNDANITVPDLLLTDFGIAKLSSATSHSSHTVRGTATFMAPEQWIGDPVPATDQYALAVMAYELLTGKLPFQGRQEQLMYAHLSTPPQPPSTLNPRLSAAIDIVILRALEKSPTNRYPSISAFANAFQQAVLSAPVPYVANPLTPVPPPPPSTGGDLHATLTITPSEAFTGSMRSLRLPRGRSINVQIPAAAYNGQTIQLNGVGEPYYPGGPAGAVIITLSVAPAERASNPNIPNSGNISRPVSSPNNQYEQPVILSNTVSDSHIAPTVNATPYPFPTPTPPPTPPRLNRRVGVIALVVVALIVILSSGTIFAVNTINTNNAHATATAISNIATAHVNATNTAQANAGATAFAQSNIDATSTAIVQATVIAQATATFIQENPNPYPPNSGTIVLYDPLNNSSTSQWSANSDTSFGGSCAFNNNNFYVDQTIAARFYICYANTTFSNFVFEVSMAIIKGDCGGFVFRADSNTLHLYQLAICQNGYYSLYRYVDTTGTNAVALISSTFSSNISQGYGVKNILAVVANGSSITLYVNHQQIANISDSSYQSGYIGLIADSYTNNTEVAYANARAWTL